METARAVESGSPRASGGAPRSGLDLFADRVARSGGRPALQRKVHGRWKSSTWSEWDRAAREIAGGLRALGVGEGDRVALLSGTRQEWVECDVGILMAGAVTVPIYPSSTPEQCEYIITDSGSSVVVVEDPHQLDKLLVPAVRAKLAGVTRVVCIADVAYLDRPDAHGRIEPRLDDVLPPGSADRDWVGSLRDLRAAGATWLNDHVGALDEIRAAIGPDHLFSIVYTSGTTGPPKGAVLTHDNVAATATALRDLLGLGETDEQLLFLPLSHIFARILEWGAVLYGCKTSFAESIPKLVQNMQEVRPTFLGAVPRVYEKAYVKLQTSFADRRKKPVSKLLIDWAMQQGKRRSLREQGGVHQHGLAVRMADRLVFDKVRATFGGRLKFFLSGGAPLSREIGEMFHAAGILVLEGYGLTETTAVGHCNRPDDYSFGTVGPAVPGAETRIADDGEILLRGRCIMKEYWRQPEATAEVIDADGWFHTGDVGELDRRGHLRITDRKKDLIITAGGKNVAPQNIEGQLKALCPYVSQVVVYGDQRPYLTALITLSEPELLDWARVNRVRFDRFSDLTGRPEVRVLVQEHVDRLNRDLASFETIKKFFLLDRDLSQEEGELTPTLKVKRKIVAERFRKQLGALYEGVPQPVDS